SQHLAPHPYPERRRVFRLADHFLELGTEARNLSHRGWHQPALNAALHAVTANEFRMALVDVSEFRNVDAVRASVVEVVRIIRNCGHKSADTHLKNVIHQVLAKHA